MFLRVFLVFHGGRMTRTSTRREKEVMWHSVTLTETIKQKTTDSIDSCFVNLQTQHFLYRGDYLVGRDGSISISTVAHGRVLFFCSLFLFSFRRSVAIAVCHRHGHGLCVECHSRCGGSAASAAASTGRGMACSWRQLLISRKEGRSRFWIISC